ncbi:hypothetical protein EAE96_000084 [Botrytis aclada]|nr:hypothetical protein EAE96_000084 [Botrytis aclada]
MIERIFSIPSYLILPVCLYITFRSNLGSYIMEKIITFDPVLVPIAIFSCLLVALGLRMVVVCCLSEFESKFEFERRCMQLKLLRSRPQIALNRPQIARRYSTADLPSKSLWSKPQYRSASLMGIPPDIRLMIYDHIIPSKIHVMRWTCRPMIFCTIYKPVINNLLAGNIFKSPLLQVHPKIYREVKEILWNRAVFGLGCADHPHHSLISMSWIASRLIRNIEIPLKSDHAYLMSNLSRSIPTMNAMARDGHLQSITILIEPFQLQCILEERLYGTFSFDLLRSLGSARTWSCKMSIRICGYESYEELFTRRLLYNFLNSNHSHGNIQNYKDLFEELHRAWGGTLYLEKTLVWENGRHVYRAPPS